jgi:hypothetical protein
MATKIGLQHCSILLPKPNTLKKLYTFVPVEKAAQVRDAIFSAGGGHVGNYSECSFNSEGVGTFKAGSNANPYVGKIEEQHHEKELKLEIIFPTWLERKIVETLKEAHPYEEVAYDILVLSNTNPGTGSGMVGELAAAQTETEFLEHLKTVFKTAMVRHTRMLNKPVKRVALCGGAGSFLVSSALRSGCDVFVTADMKYHDFFDANDRCMIADIGHYESEQFTIELLQESLAQKFPTFAVLKTEVRTNPVFYF